MSQNRLTTASGIPVADNRSARLRHPLLYTEEGHPWVARKLEAK